MHLVPLHVLYEAAVALRVQIIGPDPNPLFRRRQSEWSHPCHNVADRFSTIEFGDEAAVLGAKSCVPVHLRIIEPERTVLFVDLYIQFVRAGEYFISESSEVALLANFVGLIDDGLNGGVLVHKDLSNEGFEGHVSIAEVEVRLTSFMNGCTDRNLMPGKEIHTYMSDGAEAYRDLVLLALW